jgi:hypothetical protein
MGCKSTTNKHLASADENQSDSVKVTIRYNGKDQGTERHSLDDKLLSVINEKLKSKLGLEDGKFNLEEIEKELLAEDDEGIKNLLSVDENKTGRTAVLKEENGKIIICITLHGLQNISNHVEEFYNKTHLIGKPLSEDELKMAIFDEKTNSILFEKLASSAGGKVFTDSSAYCNGDNHLYISGGNANRQLLDTIYDVDLVKKEVHPLNSRLSQPRDLHSMIFIPNCYVFIVGGRGIKKVEYYHISKKEVFPHSDLNEERIEPTLAVVNNTYLYAFTRFFYHEGQVDTFEKINLKTSKKVWDLVTPKLDPELIGDVFTNNYFAVSYHTPGHLIFIGGECNEDDKCYLYDYEQETLRLSDIPNQPFEFGEKFFYPVHEGNNFLIPNFELPGVTILRYVANDGITAIKFENDA